MATHIDIADQRPKASGPEGPAFRSGLSLLLDALLDKTTPTSLLIFFTYVLISFKQNPFTINFTFYNADTIRSEVVKKLKDQASL